MPSSSRRRLNIVHDAPSGTVSFSSIGFTATPADCGRQPVRGSYQPCMVDWAFTARRSARSHQFSARLHSPDRAWLPIVEARMNPWTEDTAMTAAHAPYATEDSHPTARSMTAQLRDIRKKLPLRVLSEADWR